MHDFQEKDEIFEMLCSSLRSLRTPEIDRQSFWIAMPLIKKQMSCRFSIEWKEKMFWEIWNSCLNSWFRIDWLKMTTFIVKECIEMRALLINQTSQKSKFLPIHIEHINNIGCQCRTYTTNGQPNIAGPFSFTLHTRACTFNSVHRPTLAVSYLSQTFFGRITFFNFFNRVTTILCISFGQN